MATPVRSITYETNLALDSAYARTAGSMLDQIARLSAVGGEMQSALAELDEEAAALAAERKPMPPDNAVLLKTLFVYAGMLAASQSLVRANAPDIESAGAEIAGASITAKIFQTLSNRPAPVSPAALGEYLSRLSTLGIDWRIPDVMDFATGYTQTQAWIARMEGWGTGYADLARQTALNGIQKGLGPRQVAASLRTHATNIPRYAAENLTRTLQLTAYRDAVLALEVENARFLVSKIRVAVLDSATCLACFALHGTELAIGERLEDHYNGRCSEAYVLPNGPEHPAYMMLDGQIVPWQTGENIFASLPAERRNQQAAFLRTPALRNAYDAGVPLSAFVGHHDDAVFGGQIVQQSLARALGDDAKQYYVVNQ